MRRDNVTEDDVLRAIDGLVAEGVRPTQKQVHDLVGGSYNTIGPILKSWKIAQKEETLKPPVELPEAMREVMERVTGELWSTASNLAADKVAVIEAQAETSVKEAQLEVAEAAEVIADLERELGASDARLLAEQKAHKSVMEAERAADRQAVAAQTRVEEYDRQLDDLRGQVADMTVLREQFAAASAQVDELRKQVSDA